MLAEIGASIRRWKRRFSRAEWEADRLRLPRSKAGSHAPGLLLIQIDGLSRRQFERALGAGRMPFCRRLLRRGGMTLRTFYSGLPATTPAVQAELYYGVKTAVPAFCFLAPEAGTIGMMAYPSWAKRVEAELSAQGGGLLEGGSSWSNIYTGGASQQESHFCGASLGVGDLWKTGKIANIFLFGFLHFASLLRLLALLPVEFALSLFDALRGIRQGRSIRRELTFVLARVCVCVGLRELVTLGAKIDLARGLPIVHVNFLGYDEQSHRRGPSSSFAHWTLLGIDRAIRLLHEAARQSDGRDYEVWIFSDHGQVSARRFSRVQKGGLPGLVSRLWTDSPAFSGQETGAHYSDERPRYQLGSVGYSGLTVFRKNEYAVACLGPVGHVYFKRPLSAEEQTELVNGLLAGGVPGLLLKRASDGAVLWKTANGESLLPDDSVRLALPPAIRKLAAEDLVALAKHPNAGDVICLGWHPDGRSYSFAEENGAHCGPSPDELQGLLLLPPGDAYLNLGDFVRPSELRLAALSHLGRSVRPAHRRRPQPSASRLRVATYNVHYCRGTDGRFSPERVARVLRQIDPDLVALQELDCGRPRSRGDDQLAFLARELGLHSLFCPSIVDGEERYGHGLLSVHPLRLVAQTRLPTGGGPVIEPRDVLFCRVLWGTVEIAVISTHLGLGRRERTAQIDRILKPDFLGGIGKDLPALFMGDLNLAPGGNLYRRLVARWSQESATAGFRDVQAHAPQHVAVRTFPSFFPVRTLDYLFVTSQFGIRSVSAPENLLTGRASDHLPLVAELELNA